MNEGMLTPVVNEPPPCVTATATGDRVAIAADGQGRLAIEVVGL